MSAKRAKSKRREQAFRCVVELEPTHGCASTGSAMHSNLCTAPSKRCKLSRQPRLPTLQILASESRVPPAPGVRDATTARSAALSLHMDTGGCGCLGGPSLISSTRARSASDRRLSGASARHNSRPARREHVHIRAAGQSARWSDSHVRVPRKIAATCAAARSLAANGRSPSRSPPTGAARVCNPALTDCSASEKIACRLAPTSRNSDRANGSCELPRGRENAGRSFHSGFTTGANRSENVAALASRAATRENEIRVWNPTKATASKRAPNVRVRIPLSLMGNRHEATAALYQEGFAVSAKEFRSRQRVVGLAWRGFDPRSRVPQQ